NLAAYLIVDSIDRSMPSTSSWLEPMNSSTQDEETLKESHVDNITEPYKDSNEDDVPTNLEDPSSNDEHIGRANVQILLMKKRGSGKISLPSD
ncbi:hypothetical protein HHI36_000876, partial [Cryptolaemus montrouzieri]